MLYNVNNSWFNLAVEEVVVVEVVVVVVVIKF